MSFRDSNDSTDLPAPHFSEDAQPDPEPAVPSLPEPDPGVYHHEPAPRPKPTDREKMQAR